MTTDKVNKLFEKKGIVGTKEIIKAIKEGRVKTVIFASNCPNELREKIKNIETFVFDGDEEQLATRLGKPFLVAMVGYE